MRRQERSGAATASRSPGSTPPNTTGAACVFSVQVLEAMRNLGLDVSKDDAHGFMCAWHHVNHYLGTPEKWLLPKDADEIDRLWKQERDREWKKTDDGVFMTTQAVKCYKSSRPSPAGMRTPSGRSIGRLRVPARAPITCQGPEGRAACGTVPAPTTARCVRAATLARPV
ncbi:MULTISPECIES: oxygenase MpaB family protein [Streptomyces]|uniref:oxygenase MpaB family protein n=1 Tax=Streptomyces TaxID=1883 RepID=UPI000D1A96E1|nr:MULTISPECIES: oxygenase MpaB family protein [Streptomyces]